MAKNTVALSASAHTGIVGTGKVAKVIVNTHSSGVIRLIDSPNGTSGRVILADYTLPSGAQTLELDLEYYEGVYFALVSGTATVQIAYDLN